MTMFECQALNVVMISNNEYCIALAHQKEKTLCDVLKSLLNSQMLRDSFPSRILFKAEREIETHTQYMTCSVKPLSKYCRLRSTPVSRQSYANTTEIQHSKFSFSGGGGVRREKRAGWGDGEE